MSHGHAHGDAHGDRRRLALALGVTLVVLVSGVVGGLVTGSLALLADAGHMLTDAAGLGVALLASSLALRPATAARTWGLQRAEVLAAVLQAALLLAVGVLIAVEGVRRLLDPPDVASSGMLVFGAVGLAGNAVSLWILTRRGGGHDHRDHEAPGGAGAHDERPMGLNRRAAVLEVVSDGLGSVAVLLAAGVIAATGWTRADAVVSLLIGVLIVPRTVVLLREATDVLLEAVPRGLDLTAVRQHLEEQPHVIEVHDLHASQISSGLPVLTAHVVLDDSCFVDGHAPAVLDQLQACVAGHFPVRITHSTFQVEPASHADHEHGVHA